MSDNKLKLIDLQYSSYLYRGKIVGDLIYLERLIDEVLSRHFCDNKEKRKELFELILGTERIGLGNKILVFQFVFKKHKKAFIRKHPGIFRELIKINQERNIVAHYLLNTSESAVEKFVNKNEFEFVKFRNSTENLSRSQKDCDEYQILLSKNIKIMKDYLLTDQLVNADKF